MSERGVFHGLRVVFPPHPLMRSDLPRIANLLSFLLPVDSLIHFQFISRKSAPFWLKARNWPRRIAPRRWFLPYWQQSLHNCAEYVHVCVRRDAGRTEGDWLGVGLVPGLEQDGRSV
jgi:hypothetical protein